PAHDRPPRGAGEYPPARLHLVVKLGESSKTRERAEDCHDRLEFPRIHVLTVSCDVPPAREDEARPRTRMVEHRLDGSRRVLVHAPRCEHNEHSVAACYSAFDDLPVVRRSRYDRDALLEGIELL